MTEIVVFSGKGGSAETGSTAAFAAIARRPVIADRDVDAEEFHRVLPPR
ncbi:hypothetical protein JW777_08665 [bacterium]|nr:hypothetical protein [bacterium]